MTRTDSTSRWARSTHTVPFSPRSCPKPALRRPDWEEMRGTKRRNGHDLCTPLALAGIVVALVLPPGLPARGAVPDSPEQQAEVLANLARARFGTLSAAERTLVLSAPFRELAWVGPDSDPDNPANDATHGENWGPERSVRAAILRWLYTDSDVNRFLDPSGLGVAGARIEGKLDLSYVKADKPLTIVRCYIPDGIDVTFSHLQSFEVRGSSTGPIAADMSELAGDLAVRFGTYGSLSLFRARIGGNLDCTGSTLLSGGQRSVNAVESTIAGQLILHDGFTTDGIVDLRLARVGQSLSFHRAIFSGPDDTGLNAERASIGGTLYWVDIRHTPNTQPHAFVYALENFLPVVELYQGEYWRPNPLHGTKGRSRILAREFDFGLVPGRLLRWYLWFHILAGWTLTPLLFAGLSGLVRPD